MQNRGVEMRPSRGAIFRFFIGVVMLIVVIWYSKPADLLVILTGAKIEWLVIAVIIHLIATTPTALRLAYLLGRLDKFGTIYKANLGGMLFGDVTPARAGYFATPLIVSRKCPEIRKGSALNAMFYGQMFDFILRAGLLAMAILTFFYALGVSQNLYLYGFLSLALVFALAAGFAILTYNKVPKFLIPVIDRIPVVSKLYRRYTKFTQSVNYSAKNAGVAMGITIVGWLLTACRWIVVGYALGVDIPLEWYLFLFPALTATSFIPLSLAGLGFVEGGYALVFYALGRNTQTGVAFALVDRGIALTGDSLGLPFLTEVGPGIMDLNAMLQEQETSETVHAEDQDSDEPDSSETA